MSFKRKIHKLSQFPTARGGNAHKLKEILLKMGTDAERSPELAVQYKAIIEVFMAQYEEVKPVEKPVKKKAVKTEAKPKSESDSE